MDLKSALLYFVSAVILALITLNLLKYFNIIESMENVSEEAVKTVSEAVIQGMAGTSTGAGGMIEPEETYKIQPLMEDDQLGGTLDSNVVKSELKDSHAEVIPMNLLPNNDAAAVFAAQNPSGTGNVQNVGYLTSGYHIGVDSRGGTMKNPSLDIRPEPHIQKKFVGPWGNSSYEPDLYRNNVFKC